MSDYDRWLEELAVAAARAAGCSCEVQVAVDHDSDRPGVHMRHADACRFLLRMKAAES